MNCEIRQPYENYDFPYKSEPKINFFLYPPMKPVTLDESVSLKEKLALDTEMKYDPLFTIYISVPYCRARCHSCACFRGFLPECEDKESFLNDYLDCLVRQIKGYSATVRFSSAKCGAIYIGGGTASVFAPYQVDVLIKAIKESFNMVPDVEINLEGNPVDFTADYLQQVRGSGVTRLSVGFQSGQDPVLKALNTSHGAEIGIKAVKNAIAAGFRTVNVDLLYNVPGQTFDQWKEDLQAVIGYGPQNISPGDYVVFPGSKAELLINAGLLKEQHGVDTVNEWYRWTCNKLEESGYYEQVRGIFVKPGHEQQYVMLSCNKSCEILGLGAGAFSFINGYQFRLTNSSELYKEQIKNGRFFEADSVSVQANEKNFMERYIMHNFYSESVNRSEFNKRFGKDPLDVFPEIFAKLQKYALVSVNDHEVRLTQLGKKWRRSVYYEFHSPEFKKCEA